MSTEKKVWGIIVGGGSGARFGGSTPKQFLSLGDKWVIEWSLDCFANTSVVDAIIVVVPPEKVDECTARWSHYAPKLQAVIAGGEYRFDSVQNALSILPESAEVVLIHDAARPGVKTEIIEAVLEATTTNGAALPIIPVTATVKKMSSGIVRDTFDRTKLGLAQTPQGFQLALLLLGIQQAGEQAKTATDEIQLVERLRNTNVLAVPGSLRNEKITTQEDFLTVSQFLIGSNTKMDIRTGIGYDAHKLVPGRALIIGGVKFDSPVGLLGHSDADVLSHAIVDALLGAAGLGDIGVHFPDTDIQWKDSNSIDILRRVAQLLSNNLYSILSVDATLLLESPKVMPRRHEMIEHIAQALSVEKNQVSVKATTNETMGFIGRSEGAAAMAVATISRNPRV